MRRASSSRRSGRRLFPSSSFDTARSGRVDEGNVGGVTGMVFFRFKGGIGSSSRVLAEAEGGDTVAVLVQANFGQREDLIVAGVPVGRRVTDLMPEIDSINPRKDGGSIITIETTAFQGGRLCIARGGPTFTRYFSDKQHGGQRKALRAAAA